MSTDVFRQCWENWVKNPYGQPDPKEKEWIRELNQAVFGALEKNLPSHIKVTATHSPSFIYASGSEMHPTTVQSERVTLSEGTFDQRVSSALDALTRIIMAPGVRRVFFYTPVIPLGERISDGSINRRYMIIRMKTILCDE